MRTWSARLETAFGYRRLYVDAVLERAPQRGVLAVVGEIMRLAFVFAGGALIALIFWLLVAAAAARGGSLGWLVAFVACAVAATLVCISALVGIIRAAHDVGRVRRAAER